MTDDERFMKAALAEAHQSRENGEVPVGAVIVADGIIIGRGHNLTETLHDVTAHAEMLAITSAEEHLSAKYLRNCTLYVTLEPCPMCAGALGWTQIGRIVYGAADKNHGYTTCAPHVLHPKTQVTSGLMADECLEPIQDFFRTKR